MNLDLISLWHFDPQIIFLNHGSFGATPKVVLAAQAQWQRRLERQPVAFIKYELLEQMRTAAACLADFVGACPEDLVFTENATAGVNTVLNSLNLGANAQVLITNHIYGAVANAVKHFCRRQGAKLEVVEIPFPLESDQEIFTAFDQALAKVKSAQLLVIDHITSPSAVVLPVQQIIDWAHSHGIRVLVDGAHAPGSIPLDLNHLGADWYAGNCHKWLFAPKGCGFLVTAKSQQAELHPLVISHGYGAGYLEEFDWIGTRDFSGWLAIPTAIAFYQEFEQCVAANHQLVKQARSLLAKAWAVELPVPEQMLAMMATLPLPSHNYSEQTLHDLLWQNYQIEVPIIPWGNRLWLRISAQIYNQIQDYEQLAGAVRQILH
ncbi:MAG: aminotransferase class V-fold PLP-dependent enzyme [Pseudanabaenaceae cyanobacterium bins.68]|nr:aminotransferase class V-fold PLP-dependent enzyme [Pseudanabaenaceae cyanobacterium bins.68]